MKLISAGMIIHEVLIVVLQYLEYCRAWQHVDS